MDCVGSIGSDSKVGGRYQVGRSKVCKVESITTHTIQGHQSNRGSNNTCIDLWNPSTQRSSLSRHLVVVFCRSMTSFHPHQPNYRSLPTMKRSELIISVLVLWSSAFPLIAAGNAAQLASAPTSFELKFEPNLHWARVDRNWPKTFATNKSRLSLDTDVVFRSDQAPEEAHKQFFFRQQDSSGEAVLKFSKNFINKFSNKSGAIEVRFNLWTSTADVTIEADRVLTVQGTHNPQWEPVHLRLDIEKLSKFRLTYSTHEESTLVAIKDVFGKCLHPHSPHTHPFQLDSQTLGVDGPDNTHQDFTANTQLTHSLVPSTEGRGG